MNHNSLNTSPMNAKINLVSNRSAFKKNMLNSLRTDLINYLNIVSPEELKSVVESVISNIE